MDKLRMGGSNEAANIKKLARRLSATPKCALARIANIPKSQGSKFHKATTMKVLKQEAES